MIAVRLHGLEVGRLGERDGAVSFTYGERALDQPDRLGLSLALPVRPDAYGVEAAAWFAGLLPAEMSRAALCEATGRDPSDVVGLLGQVAGECAGAVSLWSGEAGAAAARPVTPTEIATELGGPAGPARFEARLAARQCLGGSREKMILVRGGRDLLVPAPGRAGSVVVKSGSPRRDGLVANEAACLELLRAAGATVARASIRGAGEDLLLECRRYDRLHLSDGTLRALHQESVLRATGRPYRARYEARGGPGFGELRRVLQRHGLRPLDDLASLARWIFVAVLVGDDDAHAGKLSLLYLDAGIRLAPFCGVTSTGVYAGVDRSFAIRPGGAERLEELDGACLERLAGDLAMHPRRLAEVAGDTADAVEAALPDVAHDVACAAGDPPVLERLEALVVARVAALRGILASV